jgi:hypothetical protein
MANRWIRIVARLAEEMIAEDCFGCIHNKNTWRKFVKNN